MMLSSLYATNNAYTNTVNEVIHTTMTDEYSMCTSCVYNYYKALPNLTKNTASLQMCENLSLISYYGDLTLVDYEHVFAYLPL